jgi:hypothetical protein
VRAADRDDAGVRAMTAKAETSLLSLRGLLDVLVANEQASPVPKSQKEGHFHAFSYATNASGGWLREVGRAPTLGGAVDSLVAISRARGTCARKRGSMNASSTSPTSRRSHGSTTRARGPRRCCAS